MTETKRRWIFYDSASKMQSNPVNTEDAQLAILKMSVKTTERFFIWTTGWEKWQPLKPYLSSKQKFFISSLQYVPQEKKILEETVTAYKIDNPTDEEVLEMKPADKEVEEEVTKTYTTLTHSNRYSKISLKEEDILSSEDMTHSGFDGDELTISRIEKPKIDFKSLSAKNLKERQDRHELKIEVLLISSKGKTFRSSSQNMSLSGSLLEDSIPFEYNQKEFDIVVINTQPCDPQHQRVSLKARTVGEGLTQRIHFVNMTAANKKALQILLENYLEHQENSV